MSFQIPVWEVERPKESLVYFVLPAIADMSTTNEPDDNIISGIAGGLVVILFILAAAALVSFLAWICNTFVSISVWFSEQFDAFARWSKQRPERKKRRAEDLREWKVKHNETQEHRQEVLSLMSEGKYDVSPLPNVYLYYFYGGIVNGVEYPKGYYAEPFWEWSSKWSKIKAARNPELAAHIASVQARMASGEYKMLPLPEGLHYYPGGTIMDAYYPEGHYQEPFWKLSWQAGWTN